MRQSLKPLRWVFVNGAIMLFAWMATADGVEWAGNLVKFVLWVSAILYLLLAFTIKSVIDDELAEKANRSVPKWLDNGFDGALCLLFAYHGWFFYASLNFVQWLCYEYIVSKGEEYREAQDKEPTYAL